MWCGQGHLLRDLTGGAGARGLPRRWAGRAGGLSEEDSGGARAVSAEGWLALRLCLHPGSAAPTAPGSVPPSLAARLDVHGFTTSPVQLPVVPSCP